MIKRSLKTVQSVDHLKLSKQVSHFALPRYVRELETTIPSIIEAQERDRYLERLHRWRKANKVQKLQETYDENCRLFISISKQKSTYHFQTKKSAAKKLPAIKLAPLSEYNRMDKHELSTRMPKTDRYHQGGKKETSFDEWA